MPKEKKEMKRRQRREEQTLKKSPESLTVSIQLQLLPPVKNVVSFPLSTYLSAVVSDGAVLQSRLSRVQSLQVCASYLLMYLLLVLNLYNI